MSDFLTSELLISRIFIPPDPLSSPIKPKRPNLFLGSQMNSSFQMASSLQATFLTQSRPQTTSHKRPIKKPESPIPEFAQEFVHNCSKSKPVCNRSVKSISLQSRESLNARATPKKALSRQASNQKSKSNIQPADCKEPTLHKILRLYKPQILHFEDKSRIRVFTTVSRAVKKSKIRLIKNSQLLNRVFGKKYREKQEEVIEVNEKNREPIIEYPKPAVTYGEKLWRLNEVSVLNL